MTYSYEFLPSVALADTAFRVKADNWSELFTGAAEALTSVMVDLADIRRERQMQVTLTAGSVEDLLYDWLSEIVYLKDAEAFLVRGGEVAVTSGSIWEARGKLWGDTIRPKHQKLGQDVKAVTYHLFNVSHEHDAYTAQVVLDI